MLRLRAPRRPRRANRAELPELGTGADVRMEPSERCRFCRPALPIRLLRDDRSFRPRPVWESALIGSS